MTPDSTPAGPADPAAALAERLFHDVIGTLELFTVYLGERLGLYRALSADGPATSAELAARTGTDERYIREWLEHHAASGLRRPGRADLPAPTSPGPPLTCPGSSSTRAPGRH